MHQVKVFTLLLSLTLLGGSVCVSAQVLPGPRVDVAAREEQAQRMFDQYRQNGVHSASAPTRLTEILAFGLSRSEANVQSLRTALAAARDTEEQVALIRLLGRQYDPKGQAVSNGLIARDLRTLTRSADKRVAQAAVFAFSRMGFPQGFMEVLDGALAAGVVDPESYYGELAHALPFAPAAEQVRIARILRGANNVYAAEIVAMLVNDGVLRSPASAQAHADLVALVTANEPAMPQALGEYGVSAAVSYANWLNAVATTQASVLDKGGAEFILRKLSDPATDPRKVMAFLSSPFAERLYAVVGERARYLVLMDRISLYARQLPMNRDMQDIVDLVGRRVAQLR